MDFFIDCLLDAFIDSIKLVPFLIVIYILIELLTRKAGNRIAMAVKKAGAVGPLIGGAVGVIPQCGLSAAAATLFSDKNLYDNINQISRKDSDTHLDGKEFSYPSNGKG